ncbi:MAG: hypothetical protein HC886_16285 [Leptolyngbyaceae cyanobacterium SM1_1_3]|nr:hypothetical protein [Leptolyngbyaceae cyanobacterium SM1_1_3]NJN04030.1 hypothetical protein [Leptolyngbyaceae cyanobacterium RM1_1_2]NJO09776.1 hypothetical protein [Leptolyngbyaceae cyanobacterium SL_1_1]
MIKPTAPFFHPTAIALVGQDNAIAHRSAIALQTRGYRGASHSSLG